MNILIPMAGDGTRFSEKGYTKPKPFIDVDGIPMIAKVIQSLNIRGTYNFVCHQKHLKIYDIKKLLTSFQIDFNIIEIEKKTDGAARTALMAKDHINNDEPLIIANSDQFLCWNSNEMLKKFRDEDQDGGIVTFQDSNPKWSFAKIINAQVVEVAEKKVISNNATVGVYYWKHGKDFVSFAEEMIAQEIKTNNEYYICPVYNNAIKANKRIGYYEIAKDSMWGLGTPEDLEYYLKNYDENYCP